MRARLLDWAPFAFSTSFSSCAAYKGKKGNERAFRIVELEGEQDGVIFRHLFHGDATPPLIQLRVFHFVRRRRVKCTLRSDSTARVETAQFFSEPHGTVLDEALQPCSAEDFRFGVHWMWTTVQEPDGQWCSLEIELD